MFRFEGFLSKIGGLGLGLDGAFKGSWKGSFGGCHGELGLSVFWGGLGVWGLCFQSSESGFGGPKFLRWGFYGLDVSVG